MSILTQQNSPFWVRNRDYTLLAAFMLLLVAVLGFLPTPISKGIDRLLEQHQGMTEQLRVACYHEARWNTDPKQREQEQMECLEGRLLDKRLAGR